MKEPNTPSPAVEAAEPPTQTTALGLGPLKRRRARAAREAAAQLQSAESEQIFRLPPNPYRMPPRRKKGLLVSALVLVGLPTLAAAAYYAFFASDQYASSAHFVIKHRSDNGAALSSLSLLGIGSTASSSVPDTLIVNDYIASQQMLQDIASAVDLRALYARPDIDWLARLKPSWGNETVSNETLLQYWQKMIAVHFDVGTGISTFEIRAFSAQDAKKIADEVFALSEKLVNRLSQRAQEDALALAKKEVDVYRQRAIAALDDLQKFQERAKQVDPQAFAAARSQIQAGVEQQLTQLQAQLDVMRKNLPEDAPGITQIKDRLTVMEQQLATERTKSTLSASGESAAEVLNEFAKLKMESDFAAQAYMSSLASLENARVQAIRQNLYLETFVRPQLAEVPQYPKAVLNTLLVGVVSFLIWGIGSLLVSAARHHV